MVVVGGRGRDATAQRCNGAETQRRRDATAQQGRRNLITQAITVTWPKRSSLAEFAKIRSPVKFIYFYTIRIPKDSFVAQMILH